MTDECFTYKVQLRTREIRIWCSFGCFNEVVWEVEEPICDMSPLDGANVEVTGNT